MKRVFVGLSYDALLQRHIPTVMIAKKQKDGRLGNFTATANLTNFESFVLDKDYTLVRKLIVLTDALSPLALEDKYCSKKRTHNSLSKVLEIDLVKRTLYSFFDLQTEQIFRLLEEHDIPLILEPPANTRLEQLVVSNEIEEMEAILSFEKTQLGIKYSLLINDAEGTSHVPSENDITLITDHPGFFILNYRLYRLQKLNSNKLKPFLKKDHIFIKRDIITTYFEKFIIPMARMTSIEAKGFDVIEDTVIEGVELKSTYDFIDEVALLELQFVYNGHRFTHGSKADKKTEVISRGENEVDIRLVKRDFGAEAKWAEQLTRKGLKENISRRFIVNEEGDPLAIFSWLRAHQSSLRDLNIAFDKLEISNKKISTEACNLKIESTAQNDWFDIFGTVKVGEFTIYFADLLDAIEQDERYYELPDGTYFVIPAAWMTKYSELAKLSTKSEKSRRIKKSQWTVISDYEELEMHSVIQKNIVDQNEIEYTPSANLKATLRPYQMEGVKWLLSHRANQLGACLADDMGLGKTLQTLAVLTYVKEQLEAGGAKDKTVTRQLSLFDTNVADEFSPLKALIILPASLVFNWFAEIKKFNPSLLVSRYLGAGRKDKARQLGEFDIVLSTYGTVQRDIDLLKNIDWEYVILDESQMIKNKESQTFKAVNELQAKSRLSLSGTPIENSLTDLWSQMQFLNPAILGNFAFFKSEYLVPIEKHQDEEQLTKLSKLIQPYILRRTKEEVAKDLPELTESVEYVQLNDKHIKLYDREKSATRNHLLNLAQDQKNNKVHVFAALTKLRQLANSAELLDVKEPPTSEKVKAVISKMEMVMKAGHKVLIFSSFTKIIDLYTELCDEEQWKYVTLTGSDSQQQRKQAVDQFQTDGEVSFFFISLKAGGTGLNLTAADYVFILDPWWNPFAEKQAIARAHRIGQNKPVTVLRFIAKDTIEEKIVKLQARKEHLSNEVMSFDREGISLDTSELNELLH